MIARTGALDVYFEDQIEILVEDPDLFSVTAVEEILTEMKVEYTKIEEAS